MHNLNIAFQTMRKAGLLARQNYLCCQTCGGYAMSTAATELIDKGTKKEEIKGCVYYHNQDNERKRDGGNFNLAYGEIDTTKYGDVGMSTKEVGKLVCKILSVFEIPYEWNGKESDRITIIQDSKEEV